MASNTRLNEIRNNAKHIEKLVNTKLVNTKLPKVPKVFVIHEKSNNNSIKRNKSTNVFKNLNNPNPLNPTSDIKNIQYRLNNEILSGPELMKRVSNSKNQYYVSRDCMINPNHNNNNNENANASGGKVMYGGKTYKVRYGARGGRYILKGGNKKYF